MATLKQVSQDFDRCFRYRRFPSFRLAPLIILIFCGLVLLGSLFLNLIRMNFLLSDLEIFSLYQAAAKNCASHLDCSLQYPS